MRPARLGTTLAAASLAIGLAAAPLAFAGGHGYPPTVSSREGFSTQSWSSERDGYVQDDGYAEHHAYGERAWSDAHAWSTHDRADIDDGLEAPVVGYLPVSFFGDAGGVGPYAIDGGYGGGGGYVYASGGGSAGAFAGARASVSASISIHGGFRGGHGGGHHGGHGCGCK